MKVFLGDGKGLPAKSCSYPVEMPYPFRSFTLVLESLKILSLLDDLRYEVLRQFGPYKRIRHGGL